jgi:hypothetical protein
MTCKFPKSDYRQTGIVWACQVCGGKRLPGDILCADCYVPLPKRPSVFGVPSEPSKKRYRHRFHSRRSEWFREANKK